jgi:exopolyphosphatase/pppGpp-phosphohydrolase
MKLRQALDEKLLDVRLRDRLLAEGKITKEDIQKALKSLPDDADRAVALEADGTNNTRQ